MKQLLRSVACIGLVAFFLLSVSACGARELPEQPVQTTAKVGESLSTLFFNWTVDSAQRVESYGDYTPKAGDMLVLTSVTVTNTGEGPITMYDSDFTLRWGQEEQETAWVFDAFTDTMQPAEDVLQAGDVRTYELLFCVPQDATTLVLCHTETYQNEKGETGAGNTFRVPLSLQ